jgi:hypothetical protein
MNWHRVLVACLLVAVEVFKIEPRDAGDFQ